MAGSVPTPCRLYRIVHFDNLPEIIEQGGIWCGNEMATRGLSYKQIGLQDLTIHRQERPVPVGLGGNLNDYVPFYFCPRSIMLYQIHTGMVPTNTFGQEPILHLIATVEKIRSFQLPFVFTDRHAKTSYAEFFEDFSDLHKLDWPTIKSNSFKGTDDDPERPTRKQAEFLVHRFVPIDAILGVAVYSQKWKEDCDKMLQKHGLEMKVKVNTAWYF